MHTKITWQFTATTGISHIPFRILTFLAGQQNGHQACKLCSHYLKQGCDPTWVNFKKCQRNKNLVYVSAQQMALLLSAKAISISNPSLGNSLTYNCWSEKNISSSCDGMGLCCEKKTMIGWRNVWSIKWRVPGQEVHQRKLGERLWKKTVEHVDWIRRMPCVVVDGESW